MEPSGDADRPLALPLVGLTGGIGSGKSTVARMFEDLDIAVIDADELARAVLAAGTPAHAAVVQAWPQTLAADGTIDRARLAAIVFGDAAERRRLEAITHPAIIAAARERARHLAESGHTFALYEAALLVETGRHGDCDGLIVVAVPEREQLARVLARGGLTEAEARARMAAQRPLADKLKLATHVIDNGGGLDQTRAQVLAVATALRARYGPRR